jgi:TolA-binding protein
MTTKIKIYLALAVTAFLIIASYSFWSNFQSGKLADAAGAAKQRAETEAQRANELEMAARKYEEKIAYLEANLNELKTLAKKQDEELKTIEITTGRARADVERARNIRSAAATAGEVCRKLAHLGHACE